MATVITMIFMGFIFNYFGYVILIIIIMVIGGGLRHPPPLNDVTELDKKRVMVGMLSLCIFIISFHPAPIQIQPVPKYGFEMVPEFNETMVVPGGFVEFNITVRNRGTALNLVYMNITLNQTLIDENWNTTLTLFGKKNNSTYNITDVDPLTLEVKEKEVVSISLGIYCPQTAITDDNATFTLNLQWNAWEYNDFGDLVKRVRMISSDILVTVE
jgi:hypothetical protein